MLVALSIPTTKQAQATKKKATIIFKYLNYCATNREAQLHFAHSDMILCIHSDTSYLLECKTHSHAGGYYYLGHKHDTTPNDVTEF